MEESLQATLQQIGPLMSNKLMVKTTLQYDLPTGSGVNQTDLQNLPSRAYSIRDDIGGMFFRDKVAGT